MGVGKPLGNGHLSLPPAGCHPSRVPISMSVPGTAADVSTSYHDSISTVSGTGSSARNAPEGGTPDHRALSFLGAGGDFQLSTLDFRLLVTARPPIAMTYDLLPLPAPCSLLPAPWSVHAREILRHQQTGGRP